MREVFSRIPKQTIGVALLGLVGTVGAYVRADYSATKMTAESTKATVDTEKIVQSERWQRQAEVNVQILDGLKELNRKQDKLIQEIGRLQGKGGK